MLPIFRGLEVSSHRRARHALRARARGAMRRLPLLRLIYRVAVEAEIHRLAAEIAFSAVFSIGPLVSLTLLVVSMLPAPSVRRTLEEIFRLGAPQATYAFVNTLTVQLQRPGHPFLVMASVVGLVWTLSSAAAAIVACLEAVVRPPLRGWVRTRLRAVVLGIAVSVGLAALSAAATLGTSVAGRVLRSTGAWVLVDGWVRNVASSAVFVLTAATFFRFGTAHRPPMSAVSWGSMVAGVIAGAATAGLTRWLNIAPRLGAGYGAATGFFAVLLWLYLVGFALLIGACVTHAIDLRRPWVRR